GLWAGAPGRCVLGAVKATVGHLLTGAGAAGLLKVLLALKHQTLPPTANFRTPPASAGLGDGPFQILDAPRPWESRDGRTPRRAAVNAFGFGGINAHVLVEEYAPASGVASAPRGLPSAGGLGVRGALTRPRS